MSASKPSSGLLYTLSFIEGASVMAAELIGAKMLAPYFGSSLYVWATVMAVTLGGLALGYFTGGILSWKTNNPRVLYTVVLLAAAFVVFMPLTSGWVLQLAGSHALIPSVIASTILFLLPPVLLMGMVSPLLIHTLAPEPGHAGKAAGAVYAISTVGGIFSTFLTGFWIIPEYGLSKPCVFMGIVLGIIPLVLLLKRNSASALLLLISVVLVSVSFWKIGRAGNTSGLRIPYQSEGLLGQLMVVDYPNYSKDGSVGPGTCRMLFVNRIWQTESNDRVDSLKHFGYIDQILKRIKGFPASSSALVCGLGGGSLVTELHEAGWNVEGCELDPRMEEVARKYFGLSPAVKVTIDDARHFIRTTPHQYDLVVLDLFRGEENPGHCFTLEAFAELKKILNPGGWLVINGHGFITRREGAGMRAVFRTLLESGFEVSLVPTGIREEGRNLVFYASAQNSGVASLIHQTGDGTAIEASKVLGNEDVVLTDDRPVLDQLNSQAYKTWRTNAITFFENEAQRGRRIPVYH
jgi:SAM-dependent methyltransferase